MEILPGGSIGLDTRAGRPTQGLLELLYTPPGELSAGICLSEKTGEMHT